MGKTYFTVSVIGILSLAVPQHFIYAQPMPPPPQVGLVTQYECDMTGENRADTLVSDILGPLLNSYVSEGRLRSWNWDAQILGGKWRRMLSLYATSVDRLLATRAEFTATLEREHPVELTELNAICHTHQDYLWQAKVGRR